MVLTLGINDRTIRRYYIRNIGAEVDTLCTYKVTAHYSETHSQRTFYIQHDQNDGAATLGMKVLREDGGE